LAENEGIAFPSCSDGRRTPKCDLGYGQVETSEEGEDALSWTRDPAEERSAPKETLNGLQMIVEATFVSRLRMQKAVDERSFPSKVGIVSEIP
jgi:hypothetical protein